MPVLKDSILINTISVHLRIHIERRKSVRVSFGKTAINIRIPSQISQKAQEKHLSDAISWAKKKAHSDPRLLDQYRIKDYGAEGHFSIFDTEIYYSIQSENRKQGKATYNSKTKTIEILLPNAMDPSEKSEMIKSLLSRVCGNIFHPKMEQRVREINGQCFHKEINSVNLKYNRSNWGSCSSAKNINLSTRLLFAPSDVRDYVIIHELAHLYEMNHSDKFWNIVQQVMPDYKEKEAWLKKYGSKCDF